MNTLVKPQIILYSDPNLLAINLVKDLINANYFVAIITKDKKAWSQKTKDLESMSSYLFISTKKYIAVSDFSYAIFLGGFTKRNNAIPDFKKFLANPSLSKAKTLAVFPLESFSNKSAKTIAVNRNAGLIYVGDMLGSGINLSSDLLMPTLIKNMVEKRTLLLGVGELFFPVSVNELSKTITKLLITADVYGKKTFLLGSQVSSSTFWKENTKHFSDLKIVYDTDILTRTLPRQNQIKRLSSNLNSLLNETYRWLIQNNNIPKKVKPEKRVLKKPKNKLFIKLKPLRPILSLIFFTLFFPILTTIIASGSLYVSYRYFLGDKIQTSQKAALLAKTLFVVGKEESNVLSKVPLLQIIYKEIRYVSYLGEVTADVFANTAPILVKTTTIFKNILSSGVYDVATPAFEIKSGLDYIYRQVSLVQIETSASAKANVLTARQVLNLFDFDKFKTLTQQGSVLVGNLPAILGADKNKNYLVLFQNNMELRPTGGFIGSYGILEFGGGKLNGLTVNDIYSADGQLKGHIEPPAPIKSYLGEANWWFRDSNWNPDFATTASRAEWFLSKEMEQSVDGTIAIDLTPIKNILNFTGPIFLPDYNLTITGNNLYEKTQQESQSEFFPGSRKKASFLTALSRILISEISKMSSKQQLGFLKTLYSSLDARSLQIHLNAKNLQDSIDKLGWGGSISNYSCGNTCYSDFFGDVEANVGVNKSNYFISRKVDFSVDIDKGKLTRKLTLNLINSANRSLGPSGQYKVYLRILIPHDSRLVSAGVVSGQGEDLLTTDIEQIGGRQEIGVYVEVLAGENKKINFSWVNDTVLSDKITSYGLFVRKQAGTGADPLNIQLNSNSMALVSQPIFTLTRPGVYTYNTTLSKDFFARTFFKR